MELDTLTERALVQLIGAPCGCHVWHLMKGDIFIREGQIYWWPFKLKREEAKIITPEEAARLSMKDALGG